MKFFKNFFKKKKDENSMNNTELQKNDSLEHKESLNPEDYDFEVTALDTINDSILTIPADEEISDEELESLDEEISDEEVESLSNIKKHLNYSEKIPFIMETYKLSFRPVVELKSAKARIGKIHIEKRGKFDYQYIYSSNIKIFLNIDSENYDIGEVIEYIFLGGSPALSFGTGPSPFDRTHMFELALKIVGEDDSISIFRDDLGFQRVEFTRDDLKRYISSH